MSTEVLSKTKKEVEMVTIPKSEYEKLKKESEAFKEWIYEGPSLVNEVINSLKRGEIRRVK